VGVEKVRWDKVSRVSAGDYQFFYGKINKNYQLRQEFFAHHGIVLAELRE
jgi:hypothetical protein